MGDLRNKMRKVEERARQEEWLRKNCPQRPRPPDPTCTVCGAKRPYVVTHDRWRPALYRCHDHLPDWACYFLENGDRDDRMCNLYSITKSQQAIRDLVKAIRDLTGNLTPLPAVFPNRMACASS